MARLGAILKWSEDHMPTQRNARPATPAVTVQPVPPRRDPAREQAQETRIAQAQAKPEPAGRLDALRRIVFRKDGPRSIVDIQRELADANRRAAALELDLTQARQAQARAELRENAARDRSAPPTAYTTPAADAAADAWIKAIAAQESIAVESVRQALAGTETRQRWNRFSPVRQWARDRAAADNRDCLGREALTTDDVILKWLGTAVNGATPYHRIRTLKKSELRAFYHGYKQLRAYEHLLPS